MPDEIRGTGEVCVVVMAWALEDQHSILQTTRRLEQHSEPQLLAHSL